jgi:4'-phosphopantetheinyl transferase
MELNIAVAPEIQWHSIMECRGYDGNSVAVYWIELSAFYSLGQYFSRVLTPQEIIRAEKYYHEADILRFIITRGILRHLLAKLTECDPSEIVFGFGSSKKPKLENPPLPIHFSVSHTKTHAVIAVANNEIGADIEAINPTFQWQDIWQHVCSKIEQNYISKATSPVSAFFQLWTRKEAIMKMLGNGIPDDLSAIPSLDGVHELNINQSNSLQTYSVISTLNAHDSNHWCSICFPESLAVQWILCEPHYFNHNLGNAHK